MWQHSWKSLRELLITGPQTSRLEDFEDLLMHIDTSRFAFLQHLSLHICTAFLVACLLIFIQMSRHKPEVPWADSIGYLAAATKLHETGVFTDQGEGSNGRVATGKNGEGMFFAPLYPAFLTLLMSADDGFYKTARCAVDDPVNIVKQCSPLDLTLPVIAQGILAALSTFLVWLSAYALTKRKEMAWVAMGLALIAPSTYSHYALVLLTENLTFPLFTLTCLLGTVGFQKRNAALLFLAGLSMGISALNRPSFPYLLYFILAATVIATIWAFAKTHKRPYFCKLTLFLVLGYALAVSPWTIRNGLKLGNWSISAGYAPYILAQRVAFNDMSWKEWGVSFVYGLPDFGDNLAAKRFRREDFERLDYYDPKSFYTHGNQDLIDQTREAAGGADKQLSYLVRTYIIKHPLKHFLVTLSLAWRGMWVGKYWGLVAIPTFLGVLIYAIRTRWWDFIVFSFPAWYMLGFNAFVSVNVVRYNIVMLPCLAIATSWSILWLYHKAKGKEAEQLQPREAA
jgi:hypothetical protein